MTEPGGNPAQVAAVVRQQRGIAAVRLHEPVPGPVDDRCDQRGQESPSPDGEQRLPGPIVSGRNEQTTSRAERDEDACDPSVVLEELRDPDGKPQHHGPRQTRPLQEPLPLADRQDPEQQERGSRSAPCARTRCAAPRSAANAAPRPLPRVRTSGRPPSRRRGSSASPRRSRPGSPRCRRLPAARRPARPGTGTRAERTGSIVGSRPSKSAAARRPTVRPSHRSPRRNGPARAGPATRVGACRRPVSTPPRSTASRASRDHVAMEIALMRIDSNGRHGFG